MTNEIDLEGRRQKIPENEKKPCDEEPCKGRTVAYNTCLSAAQTASDDVKDACEEKKDGGVVAGAGGASTLAGASVCAAVAGKVGTVAVIATTGGIGLLALGVGLLVAGAYVYFKHKAAESTAKEDCEKARQALDAAFVDVEKSCPHECWPVAPNISCACSGGS